MTIIDKIQDVKDWMSSKSRVDDEPNSDIQIKKPCLQISAKAKKIQN